MAGRYALVTWPTKQDRFASVKYVFTYDITADLVVGNVLDWISPHDLEVISQFNGKQLSGKYCDRLIFMLSKPKRGFVFACRHGLMSLFNVLANRLCLLKTDVHNYAIPGLKAAVEEGYIDIVHIILNEIVNVNMSDVACRHQRLDILIFEYPKCLKEITSLLVDGDFRSLIDSYSKTPRFKELLNETLRYAVDLKHIELVHICVGYGADMLENPVYEAARANSHLIIKVIMESVRDETTLRKLRRYAVLGYASSNNLEKMRKYFDDDVSDDVEFLQNIILYTSNVEILKFCISKGAIVDQMTIWHAIDVNGIDMVDHLITIGCDVIEMMKRAIYRGSVEKIKYIAERGEERFAKSDYMTFIVYATKHSSKR